MGDRRNRIYTLAGPDRFEAPFPIYDNSFQTPFPRMLSHPAHYDAMDFWYRPEAQETVFEHGKILYNQNRPVSHSPLEQSINIKHRRTRSGCFTCRHRRVKCDETRPICERCKKGNRECQFPQPSSSSSSRRVDSHDMRVGHNKSSPQELKNESLRSLATVDDEEEDDDEEEEEEEEGEEEEEREVKEGPRLPSRGSSQPDTGTRERRVSKSLDPRSDYPKQGRLVDGKHQGSPSSTGTTSPQSRIGTPVSAAHTPLMSQQIPTVPAKWKHLSSVMQQYLQFHREKITRYHYFLKLDPTDFIHTELIDLALDFEPLLYAVVGFAAYHHTLSTANGQFQDFWKYYCQSVMLLRKWLETHTDRNEAVLLTILQLATFEEYLGDWAGLSSHLKAAYSIFSTHYTYENVMATVKSRCIFDWLARGDVAVSLMAGASTVLDRQWFVTALEWHEDQFEEDSTHPNTIVPCLIAKLRLLGFDMAAVHSNTVNSQDPARGTQDITSRMEDLRLEMQKMHTNMQDSRSDVKTKMEGQPPICQGDLWPLNFVWIDWYATEQMHQYRTLLSLRASQARALSRHTSRQHPRLPPKPSLEDIPPEFERLSLAQCQLFEAIEKHPRAPHGAVLSCQASLALATVFLKKKPKYNIWARRKLAKMERLGYVWPPSFRQRMSELWDDVSVLDWWLPDGEYRIGLLDEIRDVVEERNKEVDARGGDERNDVREMKAVFDKLEFGQRGLRSRKDSVWSAAGAEGGASTKISSPESSAVDTDEEDDDEDDDHQKHTNRPESRDSGVSATLTASTRRAPPVLEYSNRMSGIWEG